MNMGGECRVVCGGNFGDKVKNISDICPGRGFRETLTCLKKCSLEVKVNVHWYVGCLARSQVACGKLTNISKLAGFKDPFTS